MPPQVPRGPASRSVWSAAGLPALFDASPAHPEREQPPRTKRFANFAGRPSSWAPRPNPTPGTERRSCPGKSRSGGPPAARLRLDLSSVGRLLDPLRLPPMAEQRPGGSVRRRVRAQNEPCYGLSPPMAPRPKSGLHPVPKRRINAPVGLRFTIMSNAKNGNGLAELELRLWAAAEHSPAQEPLRGCLSRFQAP
jgi:hypothetical protein